MPEAERACSEETMSSDDAADVHGIVAKSGKVSDAVCSWLAAAMRDASARMLVAWTASRAESLTSRRSVLSMPYKAGE